MAEQQPVDEQADGKGGMALALGAAVLGIGGLAYYIWNDSRAQLPEPTPIVAVAPESVCGPEPATREFALEAFQWGYRMDGQPVERLEVCEGDTVRIALSAEDYANATQHALHGLGLQLGEQYYKVEAGPGEVNTLEFLASETGEFAFTCNAYCGISADSSHGHHTMRGVLEVLPRAATEPEVAAPALPATDIARDPLDMPGPLASSGPQTLEVLLTTKEVVGSIAEGTTFEYWTFDGQVPGPMLRVRVGDTVNLTLSNDAASKNPHSIDLHAVTGPGGGAVLTQVAPGESKSFSFQALNPGVYVYHCASPVIPMHMTNGMYGLIVVEPKEGLPQVDREFYVMQGELYIAGTEGHQEFSTDRMLAEQPSYVVFNGRTGALVDKAPRVSVGETVRIYFGNGGISDISSFHVIGEIFDRVYHEGGSLVNENVQTTLVPAGGATVVEFMVDVPGRYILVDHALARLGKGAAGFFYADGEEQPDIYQGGPADESGH